MAEDITFTSKFSGKQLSGKLYLREGAPMLLMCYGFPGDNRNSDIAEKVYESGISVFQLNPRGVEESEGDFTFEGAIEDVLATIEQLSCFNIDKNKIGLLGHCYGAVYTTYAAANDPRVNVLILMAPVVDVLQVKRDYDKLEPSGFDKFLAESKHGARKGFYGARGDPEYWKQEQAILQEKYAPYKWIGKLKNTSVLVLIGTNDVDTPLYHTDKLLEAGTNLKPPIKRIIYEGADHYFTTVRKQLISDIVNFLKEVWF